MGDQLQSHHLHAGIAPGSVVDKRAFCPQVSFWREFYSSNCRVSLVIAGRCGLGLGVDRNQWLARLRLSGLEHDGTFLSRDSYCCRSANTFASTWHRWRGDRFINWLQRDACGRFVLLYQEAGPSFMGMSAATS